MDCSSKIEKRQRSSKTLPELVGSLPDGVLGHIGSHLYGSVSDRARKRFEEAQEIVGVWAVKTNRYGGEYKGWSKPIAYAGEFGDEDEEDDGSFVGTMISWLVVESSESTRSRDLQLSYYYAKLNNMVFESWEEYGEEFVLVWKVLCVQTEGGNPVSVGVGNVPRVCLYLCSDGVMVITEM